MYYRLIGKWGIRIHWWYYFLSMTFPSKVKLLNMIMEYGMIILLSLLIANALNFQTFLNRKVIHGNKIVANALITFIFYTQLVTNLLYDDSVVEGDDKNQMIK